METPAKERSLELQLNEQSRGEKKSQVLSRGRPWGASSPDWGGGTHWGLETGRQGAERHQAETLYTQRWDSLGPAPSHASGWQIRQAGREKFIFWTSETREQASQVVLVVKNAPASARDVRDVGSVAVLGRYSGGGHGSPLQCSCLENPCTGTWWAAVHTVAKSQTWPKRLSTAQPRHREGQGRSGWFKTRNEANVCKRPLVPLPYSVVNTNTLEVRRFILISSAPTH